MVALIVALALGDFLYERARSAWNCHWVLTDAQDGTALVTQEHWSGHGSVDYQYTVGQNQFKGFSVRNPKDQKKVEIGGQTTVYFSASHPWLSLLYKPDPEDVLPGFPVILVALAFEAFAVITIIKPKSGWAFSFVEEEQKDGADKNPNRS